MSYFLTDFILKREKRDTSRKDSRKKRKKTPQMKQLIPLYAHRSQVLKILKQNRKIKRANDRISKRMRKDSDESNSCIDVKPK